MLVVEESSLASSAQVRNQLRIATTLRIPRVVLVGDERRLGAVEAGRPFAPRKAAGMETAVMDDIVRRRDAALPVKRSGTLHLSAARPNRQPRSAGAQGRVRRVAASGIAPARPRA